MTILVVEDNSALRKLLLELIRTRTEAEIIEAGNLLEALELLPRADAVLSDGQFPKTPSSKSSFELWPALRAAFYASLFERFPKLARAGARDRFVVLSGDSGGVIRARLLGHPAFEKPAGAAAAIDALLAAVEPPPRLIDDPRVQEADLENSGVRSDERDESETALLRPLKPEPDATGMP